MHSAKVLADSTSPEGIRLITFELTYPRIVHSELMTHRVFSRNGASSRAIPIEKLINNVIDNPYVPTEWGLNQKGMQSKSIITDQMIIGNCSYQWLKARDEAVASAKKLSELGIHKQIVNRLLEPFQWYTCIVSSTEWSNFLHQRCHEDAHPEIRKIAELVKYQINNNMSNIIGYSDWHLPFILEKEANLAIDIKKKIAVGRCARVSYLNHNGKRDIEADILLHDRLLENGHFSPFEHVARPVEAGLVDTGNFKGWLQYRKEIPSESDFRR